MATLITGGTGFVGTYVLKRLLAQGEEVVAYDQMPDTALLEAVLGKDAKRVTVVRGDILDLALLLRVAKEHRVDRVLHLAYVLGAANERNPALATRVNVEGTNNAFEMAGLLGVRRVVWASSIAVFGPGSVRADGRVGPDGPFDPQTIYGACKLTNELAARRYAHIYGLEPIGLSFPVVYGPEVRRGWSGFLCDLASSLAQGERHPVAPRNEHMVNWGYVEDIAEAVVVALAAPPPARRVYTVAGSEATVKAAVDSACRLFPGVEVRAMEGYPMVRLETKFDPETISADLGWKPQVDVEEGVRRIVEHYSHRS